MPRAGRHSSMPGRRGSISAPPIEPGFQAYGQPGPFGHFAALGQQDHRVGPQLFGKVEKIGPGSLNWNGGVLFGLTPAAPRLTLRWQAEYELHF